MTKSQHINLLLNEVFLGYEPKRFLVESINASAQSGEMIALVGRNGTGKSTLLRTISGIQEILKGSVLLNQRPFKEYESRELASLISFVGTGNRSAENMTVYEVVSMGRHPYTNWWGALKQSDHIKIKESIAFVGLENFISSKIEQLSDGERQRVMIAMALAQDTKIIVLDEPSAFLDIPNRIGIAEVLYKLKKANRTVIFSTHDFDNVFTYADKVWLIHDHNLIEGAPEDLGIDKVYDLIFKDSKVDFDYDNLRFIRENTADKEIVLQSSVDASIQYWTSRALERSGYSVQTENNPSLDKVIVKKEGERMLWILDEKNTTNRFSTLYDMSRYLTSKK